MLGNWLRRHPSPAGAEAPADATAPARPDREARELVAAYLREVAAASTGPVAAAPAPALTGGHLAYARHSAA